MSTYAVIGWNDTLVKRGAYTEAKCLADKFPDYIKTYDGNTNIDIDDIRSNSKRVIFTYQNPERYRSRNLLNPKYYNIDIQYIRKNYFTFYKYKTTNGFSTYRENPFYINYVPMMIPMFKPMKTNYNKIVIGYYLRPSYRPDDFKMFIQFIKDLDIDVDLYVMGKARYCFKIHNKHIINEYHTYDNILFYNNITHYVYSESNAFDPWPTTLQEAVNLNKQIIILKQHRNFSDGITDIENCIQYHTKLNKDIYHDNINSILNIWKYINYYYTVFNNNFEYTFDIHKYKNINDWFESLE